VRNAVNPPTLSLKEIVGVVERTDSETQWICVLLWALTEGIPLGVRKIKQNWNDQYLYPSEREEEPQKESAIASVALKVGELKCQLRVSVAAASEMGALSLWF
jgi:hypothetical protein